MIERAWKTLDQLCFTYSYAPGDRLLLKAGDVWNEEQLFPRGSGALGNPIIIDKYDIGADPVLNGAGMNCVVKLENSEYIEINNLEITDINPGTWGMVGVGIYGVDFPVPVLPVAKSDPGAIWRER